MIDEESSEYDQETFWDEEWGARRETTLWWRRDSMSNGRWLCVEQPDLEGNVWVVIERVYQKDLTPDEADAMAAALIEAARLGRLNIAKREQERQRQAELRAECDSRGGHVWPKVIQYRQDWVCEHCGSAPETAATTLSYGDRPEVWS